jgi:hypothetical protein
MDERGELVLTEGQIHALVYFQVTKLNATYNFEYLYVDSLQDPHPGAIQVVPTLKSRDGFFVTFAGAPLNELSVLHWRVTIVRTSALVQIDAPEDLYLRMPQDIIMGVTFVNPRSTTTYGFSELRVENLIDPVNTQPVIHIQVGFKNTLGFYVAVNPRPRNDNFFLKVRTP